MAIPTRSRAARPIRQKLWVIPNDLKGSTRVLKKEIGKKSNRVLNSLTKYFHFELNRLNKMRAR